MRQFSDRYAIRALQNLPEKELRYFNTVIVTADIDEGFRHSAILRTLLRRVLRNGKPFQNLRLVVPKHFAEQSAKDDRRR